MEARLNLRFQSLICFDVETSFSALDAGRAQSRSETTNSISGG